MDELIRLTAKYAIVGVVLIAGYVWLRLPKKQRLEMFAVILLAGIVALVVSRLAGKLFYDPRPFVSQHKTPLIEHAADNGFPSDHALLAMTLTASVYLYRKKWAMAAFAFTLAVSAARVLARVHSPIDILGAWGIAICAVVIAAYGLRATPWFRPNPAKE